MRRSRELARCLVLDARIETPTVCITLTTHDPDLPASVYRDGSAVLFKRLRRLYGRVEYFGAIEFTTGRSVTSGGRRRMHGHYLVKGLPADRVLEVERIVRETWAESTGAIIVEVAALVSPGAALGYLGLHHRKPSQSPPAEWRGMTERSSRGYWSKPIAELRAQASQELAIESIAHVEGLSIEEAAIAYALRDPCRVIEVREYANRGIVEPMGEFVPMAAVGGSMTMAELRTLMLPGEGVNT
jgi:hypothetical protein